MRSILVILDHVSEMSDRTYSQMQQALEKPPIWSLFKEGELKPEKW
jgi:hypothetical protein